MKTFVTTKQCNIKVRYKVMIKQTQWDNVFFIEQAPILDTIKNIRS